MPCVSLAHRKIYRETVARRIEMRRLLRSTEKAAAKSAKKAARMQAAQAKAALKSVKKLSKETPQKTAKKTQKVMRFKPTPKSVSQPQPQPQPSSQNLSTLHSNLIATAKTAPTQLVQATSPRPLVSYISSTMQDFREGVEVKILHAKHRLSIDNPIAVNAAFTGWPATRVNGLGDGRVDFLRPSAGQRAEGKVREARNDGSERHRVEEKQIAHPTGILRHRPTRAELINAESSIGRTLFGPIPTGHRREFFHDRGNVWIWHEGWTEPNHGPHQITVRYEVRPTGVFKKLSAGSYVALEGNELENFRRAAHAYLYLIKRHLYHLA